MSDGNLHSAVNPNSRKKEGESKKLLGYTIAKLL